MSVKTITITEDAYTRLAALKEHGESFSEVVNRITLKNSLFELAGVLSEKEAKALERAVLKTRTRMRQRTKQLVQEFS